MEVEGVFWENLDRRVYSNGTIVYKVRPVPWTSVPLLCSPIGNLQEGGVVEHGEFLVGSLADGGQVTLLPSLGGEQVGAKTKIMTNTTKNGGQASKPGGEQVWAPRIFESKERSLAKFCRWCNPIQLHFPNRWI